jgi:hypothetical protein
MGGRLLFTTLSNCDGPSGGSEGRRSKRIVVQSFAGGEEVIICGCYDRGTGGCALYEGDSELCHRVASMSD